MHLRAGAARLRAGAGSRALAIAAALMALAGAVRSAQAQCPSCSNPNLPAPAPPVLSTAAAPAGRYYAVSLDAVYLRADGVIQGTGATSFTDKVERSADTLYQHRLVRLGAVYAFTDRFAIQVVAPFEDREMLNRALPPEGAFGLRRHLDLTGLGDVVAAGRLIVAGAARADAPRVALTAGASLPTGKTLPAPAGDDGPYETVMQIGNGTVLPVLGAEGWRALGPRAFASGRAEGRLSLYANRDGFRRGSAADAAILGGARVLDGRLALAAGVQGAVRAADWRAGQALDNTGGATLYALGTVSVDVGGGVSIAGSLRVPALRTVEGFQLAESFGCALGVAFSGRRR